MGDNGWVDHRENGITYSFDATKCMFSWGNLSEKLRMAHLNCQDEVIVDLFAGIGYFVLPFLVRYILVIIVLASSFISKSSITLGTFISGEEYDHFSSLAVLSFIVFDVF